MIQRTAKTLFATVASCLAITACGESQGAPKCGDPEVTALLEKTVYESTRNAFSLNNTGYSYAEVQRLAATGDGYKTMLNVVNEVFLLDKVTATGVRTTGVDSAVGISQCSTKLVLQTKEGLEESHNIHYTAQYSDDGQELYVEILQ